MSIYRRRRNKPMLSAAAILGAAFYFTDDGLADAFYFDDALTMRYVTAD